MITTLTLNPSIDRTVMVEDLLVGEVQRVLETRTEAGGKGVNIARALSTNGHQVRAIFPIDESTRPEFLGQLEPLGVICEAQPRERQTRTNLSITGADGTTTKLNEAGPALEPELFEALLLAAVERENAGVLAAAGSLPTGADPQTYAALSARMASPERNLAVDTSGAPLAAMVGVGCAVVKPNLEELESLVGAQLLTLGEVIEAATEFHHKGWASVLVSLGPDGAVLIDNDGVHHGRANVEAVRNTVGAGDATLAGFLAAKSAGEGGAAALAEALAWAHAAVSSPGTAAPPAAASDRATVTMTSQLDPESQFSEHTSRETE